MNKIYYARGAGASHHCVIISYQYRYEAKNVIEVYKKLAENFSDLWSYKIKIDVPATLFLWLAKMFGYNVTVTLNEIKIER